MSCWLSWRWSSERLLRGTDCSMYSDGLFCVITQAEARIWALFWAKMQIAWCLHQGKNLLCLATPVGVTTMFVAGHKASQSLALEFSIVFYLTFTARIIVIPILQYLSIEFSQMTIWSSTALMPVRAQGNSQLNPCFFWAIKLLRSLSIRVWMQVEFMGICPPIDKMDAGLAVLRNCRWWYYIFAWQYTSLELPWKLYHKAWPYKN